MGSQLSKIFDPCLSSQKSHNLKEIKQRGDRACVWHSHLIDSSTLIYGHHQLLWLVPLMTQRWADIFQGVRFRVSPMGECSLCCPLLYSKTLDSEKKEDKIVDLLEDI